MLQPFAYFGIAVSAAIGYFVFGDAVTAAMLAGGASSPSVIHFSGVNGGWRGARRRSLSSKARHRDRNGHPAIVEFTALTSSAAQLK